MQVVRSGLGCPGARTSLIGGAGCLAMLGLVFWSNLRHFAYVWSTDDNYSHGFLVPLISLFFANEAARRGPVPIRGGVGPGLGLLAAALAGKMTTVVIPVGIVGDLSFLLGLAGICALVAGAPALRRYGFAIAFLGFMVPLPVALYSTLASPLQLLVSRIAATLLDLLGIPVLRQGNMMTLPGGVQMFVAEACSGMRQLTGFLALTTAVAYLSTRSAWYRALLVVSSVPIAMTANVVRVVLTGEIMFRLDPSYASGTYHTLEGLLMMGFGLLLLGGECLMLDAVFPRRPDGGRVVPSAGGSAGARGGTPRGAIGRVVTGVALLTLGVGARAGVERATETPRPPLKRPLASLPSHLGRWVGRDEPVAPEIAERSQADQYLNRVYQDPDRPGPRLTLWINYSEHGLNLRHSPEVCLPSGGWTKVESLCRVLEVAGASGGKVPLTRLAYRQGELVQGIGFWYYIFGEGALEHFVRSLPIASRSSHGQTTRGSGLTVEVFCEADPDAEALRDFAEALLPALEPILPEPRAQYFIP